MLVLHGTAPVTPPTDRGQKVMRAAKLRYWDVCFNEYLVTTHGRACVPDSAVPLDAHRRYTIVISKRADRPRNAKRSCGAAWLPWGPHGDGAGRVDAGVILLRNLLPAPGFKHDAHAIVKPGSGPKVMGRYFPRGTYTSTRAFERRGC